MIEPAALGGRRERDEGVRGELDAKFAEIVAAPP